MKKLSRGDYVISADIAATREYYASQPAYLVKCSCPGCQNFLKSAGAFAAELEAAVGAFGVDWRKPETIETLFASGGRVVYEAEYKIVGQRVKSPKIYRVHKNELGGIFVMNPDAFWEINERMKVLFLKGEDGTVEARLRAELPWTMETLGCIYDGKSRAERPVKGRLARTFDAVKKIKKSMGGN